MQKTVEIAVGKNDTIWPLLFVYSHVIDMLQKILLQNRDKQSVKIAKSVPGDQLNSA